MLSAFGLGSFVPSLRYASGGSPLPAPFSSSLTEERQNPRGIPWGQPFLAARLGLEPRYHGPEPCVLPLDDLAISVIIHKNIGSSTKPCYYTLVQKLKVITWNIGFGAMGAEAEVKMDGGSRLIPSSRAHVKKNMQGIIEFVRGHDADVFLLQEVSFGSVLNHWYNVERHIRKALETFRIEFASNFKFPLWLRFLRNEHGISTYVHPRNDFSLITTRRFSISEIYYAIFRRRDRFITTLVTPEGGPSIAVINTHLSSFDADGAIRKQQCKELLDYAYGLHADGHRVVIGADWNMRIAPDELDSPAQDVRYRYDFPRELLRDGWSIHTCVGTPTVRSGNEPYHKGSSSTAIIDGFVCSPLITVEHVDAVDLDFQYSDHNPVEIVISY